MKTTRWIICYDVVSDKRRRRVMKKLEGHGHRVQYSVFECDLTRDQLERLCKALMKLIDEQTDSVRAYPLDDNNWDRVKLLGTATLLTNPYLYIV